MKRKETDDVSAESDEGRSWCCRAPVIDAGGHWRCAQCGKANASTTDHRAAPSSMKTKPMSREDKWISEMYAAA